MTVVRDAARGVFTNLEHCKVCGGPVYWSLSPQGRRIRFVVDGDDHPTREVHDARYCQAWSDAQREQS